MANDSFDININGVGGASNAQAAKIDVSGLQKSIDTIASELKKLDTTSFQKSLRDLASNIQKSAIAANSFIESMVKLEAKISASLKSDLGSSPITKTVTQTTSTEDKKSIAGLQSAGSEKFVNSITSLSDSIEKLTSGIKDGFKNKSEERNGAPKKEDATSDFKKLLSAIGISSILKQISDNEVLAPARATGMLINSNVISNPKQAGNELLASYQNRVANNTGTIGSGIGAVIGGIAGSILPGLGTVIGAGVGGALGLGAGNSLGQTKMATELPTLQRSLTSDYYSNLSRQVPQYNEFAQSQYGNKGFGSAESFQDPYFESKAALGKSYSRFAGGSLSSETTTDILKSLTAQGTSSPQDLNITGNLLGQIARFTGKTSIDIERVYKSVEKSGMNPNEGLQKTLSLLQSGLSVKEAEQAIQSTSQRTEAFSEGQNAYFGATPFQQFTAQQAGKTAGIDVEKFHQGNENEVKKAHEIFIEANKELRSGHIGNASIKAQILETQAFITPAMADNNLQVSKDKKDKGFIALSEGQEKVIQKQKEAISTGAKGRAPSQIIDEALSEIGKSTESFSSLTDASNSLIESFKDATASFGHFVQKNSVLKGLWESPKQLSTQTAGGR